MPPRGRRTHRSPGAVRLPTSLVSRPAQSQIQLPFLFGPTSVLGLRPFLECSALGLDGACPRVIAPVCLRLVPLAPSRLPAADARAALPRLPFPCGARFRGAPPLSQTQVPPCGAASSTTFRPRKPIDDHNRCRINQRAPAVRNRRFGKEFLRKDALRCTEGRRDDRSRWFVGCLS